MQHWQAFDKNWFLKHQTILLFLLRFSLFRWLLRIKDSRKIVGILPDCIHFDNADGTIDFVGRIHDKYSKLVYNEFKYLWWVLHFVDWLVLDRQKFIPSFGFDSLTKYPDADTETSTVDGPIAHEDIGKTYSTLWDTVHDAATGTSASDSASLGEAMKVSVSNFGGNYYIYINRSAYLFDTSSLTASAIISAATFSVYGFSVIDDLAASANVYSSSPASNTALTTADYDAFGTTAYSSAKLFSALSGSYNNWTLNSSGLAAISKTSITKFALRESTYDVADSAPSEPGEEEVLTSSFFAYFADQTGTSNDPKLVVTYSIPSFNPGKRIIVVN